MSLPLSTESGQTQQGIVCRPKSFLALHSYFLSGMEDGYLRNLCA